MDIKAAIIHEFEEKQDIPLEFRFTEFVQAYGSYVIKLGLEPKMVDERYNKALLLKKQEEQDEFSLVLEVTLEHNIKDYAEFALKNINNMFEQFMYRKEQMRRVGIKDAVRGQIYLLLIRSTDELPEFIDLSEYDNKEELEKIRLQWFNQVFYLYKERLYLETKEVINTGNSWLAARGEKFNYIKEIKKRCESRKVFKSENFERFDFRGFDTQNCIFIDCNLNNANFAHCNLYNAAFINCSLNGTIFYAAVLNDCISLNGATKEKVVDLYKKYL